MPMESLESVRVASFPKSGGSDMSTEIKLQTPRVWLSPLQTFPYIC